LITYEQALSGLEKTNAVCGKTKKRELEEQIKNLNGSLQKKKWKLKLCHNRPAIWDY
jgi:hypothetical protein